MAEKAKIIVFNKDGRKDKEITVMFNPKDYATTLTAKTEGTGAGVYYYGTSLEKLEVNLFFDTYEQQSDVRSKTKEIADLVMPTVPGKKTKHPPVCLFVWGGFVYQGIVEQVTQKFTMFLATGIPVRAELKVDFKSVMSEKEETRYQGKEACRKLWTVKSGDRLDRIAYYTLKDPGLWRVIAVENKIENPREFPTEGDLGRVLVIPDV